MWVLGGLGFCEFCEAFEAQEPFFPSDVEEYCVGAKETRVQVPVLLGK